MKLLVALILVALVAGCTQGGGTVSEQVQFQTLDGFEIHGTFYANPEKPGLILLPMLGETQSSWNQFVPYLTNDFQVLVIDLRGHGKSTKQNGQGKSWNLFLENDFKNMVFDVAAAKQFLQQRGVTSIGIMGASIGANVALNEVTNVDALVLLSPGLDYKGVKTLEAVKLYTKPLLIIASEDDPSSAAASRQLYNASPLSPEQKELVVMQAAGHGTAMLFKETTNQVILSWLKNEFG
ncbi:MAG: lysophospholipase [Nanoarchaeota archaeon]|nr:lysophospholipase [Nanoarchaeota archaeon]